MILNYLKRSIARKTAAAFSLPSLQIEFTTAHEKLTLGIGTNKATFLIDEFGAAQGAEFPPVFLSLLMACQGFDFADHGIMGRQMGSGHTSFLLENG